MLDVYFKNVGSKEAEIGMIYHVFQGDNVHNEFTTFDSRGEAAAYLHQTKVELVICNLEFIVTKYDLDPALKNQMRLTAEERLKACFEWCSLQKEAAWNDHTTFMKMCKQIAKMEEFMTTLVNSLKDEEREFGIYYWKMYFNFIRSEVANGKNIPNKNKEGQGAK